MELQTIQPPPQTLRLRPKIYFLHPGYPSLSNRLITLARADGVSPDFGVHHRTALVACQIIANNAFNGYLALDQEGKRLVNTPIEGVLTAGYYYFFVPGIDRYPVVPSFRDWEFPHGNVPTLWPEVQSDPGVGLCSVSSYTRLLESAYLVPKEEADWFARNDMKRYSSDFGLGVNSSNNLVQMKVDIHRLFDARGFVIAPKSVQIGGIPQYATHIINYREHEFFPTYHNVLVRHLPLDSQPYLFACFAWAVLLSVKDFLVDNGSRPRHVVRCVAFLDEYNDPQAKYDMGVMSGAELTSVYGGGGSWAATAAPKKRPASTVYDETVELLDSSDDEDPKDHAFDSPVKVMEALQTSDRLEE